MKFSNVYIYIYRRDAESHLRHLRDQHTIMSKDYDSLKRQLKKKRIVLNLVKQNLPGLEAQQKDQEIALKHAQDDRSNKNKEIQKLKEEIDYHIARLLQQENVEKDKKEVKKQ